MVTYVPEGGGGEGGGEREEPQFYLLLQIDIITVPFCIVNDKYLNI